MKVIYRIPVEQYSFVEVQKDYEKEPTTDDIQDTYLQLTEAFKPKTGVSDKDFNKALDRYLTDGDGELEVYMQMNDRQKYVFQCIKKAFKRLKAKE